MSFATVTTMPSSAATEVIANILKIRLRANTTEIIFFILFSSENQDNYILTH